MMLPAIFNPNHNNLSLFDDFFDFPTIPVFGDFERGYARNLMKTDVHEHDDHYEMDIDLPGFKKEDIKLELENGYLRVSAERKDEKKENDKDGKVIRQERYFGSASRNFYVGDVTEEEVKARFDNGVLHLDVPKKENALPEKKMIAIEGPKEEEKE